MFFVGDIVRILDGNPIVDYGPSWVRGMNAFIGQVCEVASVEQRSAGWYAIRLDPLGNVVLNSEGFDVTNYVFEERGLELVERPKCDEKIFEMDDITGLLI